MRGCPAGPTCGHRRIVDDYRRERQRQETAMENATLGYAAEQVDYLRDNPLVTFKQTLIQTKRSEGNLVEPDSTDSKVMAARAAAENRRYEAYVAANPKPTLEESRAYNETGLLGASLSVSGNDLAALRTVRGGFSDPFHEAVATAILDQADANLPHDAEAVTAVLRERGQLPLLMDPQVPLRTIDPMQYGLGRWEANGVPYQANAYAVEVRADHRARYLQDVGTRLVNGASSAAEVGDDPGFAREQAAHELIACPPVIGYDLQPARAQSREAVDTRQPRVVQVPRSASTDTGPLQHVHGKREALRPAR